MNCTQSRQLIDELASGNASVIQQQAMQQHLEGCAACRQHLSATREMLLRLRELPVPPPTPSFESNIMQALDRHTHRHAGKRWFAAGFGSALAAGLLMWAVFVGQLPPTSTPEGIQLVTIALETNQVKKVSLAFNAPADIDDAMVVLDLPANVELAGFPGKRQLSWKTRLKPGVNRLTLPLIANSPVDDLLVARLSKDGKTHEFKLRLKTASAATSALTPARDLS